MQLSSRCPANLFLVTSKPLMEREIPGISSLSSTLFISLCSTFSLVSPKQWNIYIYHESLPAISVHFTDTLAEDLFEVTSCYFPIDFTPVRDEKNYSFFAIYVVLFPQPPNDPLPVTKEALVSSLRKCLTATEKFAEVCLHITLCWLLKFPFQFCLPLLLDKLTSDFPSAKLDVLCTLAAGACVYGAANLHPFLQSLWMTIKREVIISWPE